MAAPAWWRCAVTSRDKADDALMIGYFAGTAVVGLLVVVGDSNPALVAAFGHSFVLTIFGVGYLALGVVGCLTRLGRHRVAEQRVILALATYALIHGGMLVADGAWSSGLRLLVAPLMMLSYARGMGSLTLSVGQVRSVHRALGGPRDD